MGIITKNPINNCDFILIDFFYSGKLFLKLRKTTSQASGQYFIRIITSLVYSLKKTIEKERPHG